MNVLNSVIVEGQITEVVDNQVNYIIKISTPRHFKDPTGKSHTENNEFKIIVFKSSVPEMFMEIGRGVRIVGRLKQNKFYAENKMHSEIIIIAEHIEFKPKIK